MFAWMRAHGEGIGAGLIFFILALLFHWHSVLHPLTSVGSMTDELLLSWTLDWNADYFAHPEGSLFDTPFFAPFPRTLAYTEHVVGLSLIAWPVTRLSDTPLLSYNLLLILSTWLTGWCAWLLTRGLGAGWKGAVIAGIIAALAPTRLLHAPGHVNILSQWWIPLSLYFLHRYLRTHDRRILLFIGASVLGQGLVSPQGFALQLVALAVVCGAFWCAQKEQRKRIFSVIAVVGLALILVSPLLIPYAQTMNDPSVVRPPALRLLHAPSLSEILLPQWAMPFSQLERNVGAGVIPLLLIVCALFTLRRKRDAEENPDARTVTPYLLLALTGILLALGPAMTLVRDGPSLPGLYAALEYLPGFAAIRAVGRFSLLSLLGLAVIVGLRWRSLTAWAGRRAPILQAALCALLLAEFTVTAPRAYSLDPTLLAARPVDEWLKRIPRECLLAEVPFKDFRTTAGVEESARFIYYTRYHGLRIVNGYAGAAPVGYYPLERTAHHGDPAVALAGLKAWGADIIVIHPDLFTPPRGQEILAHLRSRADVEEITRFPDSFVFRFRGEGVHDCARAAPAGV